MYRESSQLLYSKPELLEAWLSPASINYHRDLEVLILLNKWLSFIHPCSYSVNYPVLANKSHCLKHQRHLVSRRVIIVQDLSQSSARYRLRVLLFYCWPWNKALPSKLQLNISNWRPIQLELIATSENRGGDTSLMQGYSQQYVPHISNKSGYWRETTLGWGSMWSFFTKT